MSDIGKPVLTSLCIKTVWLSDIAAFIGEIARPISIIATSCAAAYAILILAAKVNSTEASVYMGAVFLGVGALYGAKAWEKVTQTRADANVKVESAKANASQ